jgi:acetyltransferase-like isoleucine patch superfamily enzyme
MYPATTCNTRSNHPDGDMIGLMIDHATGVVVGETAVIGSNCSFLHGVTLGSSGKDRGMRHPQVGNGVLIGCNASVLGYIEIGDNCKIGSGSIVLKPVPAGCTAVGNPARIVGKSQSLQSAASTMDLALHDVVTSDGRLFENTWSACIFGSTAFRGIAFILLNVLFISISAYF